jgi:hypothetical protein
MDEILLKVALNIIALPELTTFVVIGTDCTGSCKSNYHTITTAPTDCIDGSSNNKTLNARYNGQKERLCLIIDKCRHQKLCKRAQKILAAAPLRVMASRYNPCE